MSASSAAARRSRSKGASGEREAIRFLKDRLGFDYRRNATGSFGHDQGGVDLIPESGPPGIPDIQVKNYARFSALEWLASPYREGMEEGIVWMIKAPRRGWFFVGRSDELFQLVGGELIWERICLEGAFGIAFLAFRVAFEDSGEGSEE